MISTPTVENTTENPRTKNTEFKIIFDLLIDTIPDPVFWLRSVMVVPEIYAKNAGIMGKIQGATNEPRPARAAIAMVISAMN